eukprot:341313-Prymnesium_polylepis.1
MAARRAPLAPPTSQHYNKYDPPPKWEPEPSVFDGGFVLAGEQAEPCGDFSVGQLVQVTRTDG